VKIETINLKIDLLSSGRQIFNSALTIRGFTTRIKRVAQSGLGEKESNDSDLKPLYTSSLVNSFGSGAVSPFLGVYAVKLGASPSEMGWFQSVSNLSPNLMQVPWGRLSDKVGRRVPFILVGGLITAALWMPLIWVHSAIELILIIAAQSLLGSMIIPAWNALVGNLVHSSKRGRGIGVLSRAAAIGSLLATLLAGYIMIVESGSLHQMFFITLVIAIVCGVVSSLAILVTREKPPNNDSRGSFFGVQEVLEQVRSNPSLARFSLVSAIFGFFMAVSWPLFSITMISVLNLSMLDVALLSVVGGAVTIALQPWGGKLVDRVGRRSIMVVYRFGLILVPILYGLAFNVYYLYLVNVITSVLSAPGDIAMFAYLLDVSPEEHMGALTAFYNLLTGTVYFAGSLLGGYLANYFIGIVGLVLGLQLVYLISAVGRGIGAFAFTSIKEENKYPSTLRKELWAIVHKLPLP
jgi:DHA1 family multidrug resistance protein-like MFS transporter